MIIDDVLSAGTAARESINLIKIYDALPKFFLVGLDRQEKGNGDFSAKHDLAKNFGINVLSIINLDDLIYFSLNNENFSSYAEELERYRTEWGA